MSIISVINCFYNCIYNFKKMSTLEPQKNLDDYAKDNTKNNTKDDVTGKAEEVVVGFNYTTYKNDWIKKIIKTKTYEKSGNSEDNSRDKNKCNEFNINYAQLEKLYSVAKNNK